MMPLMAEELHEYCAAVGVVGSDSANMTVDALRALVHRGRTGTGIGGIIVSREFESYQSSQAATDYYTPEVAEYISSREFIATVGHNRWPTSGSADEHPSPTLGNHVVFSLNGTLPETSNLEDKLSLRNIKHTRFNDGEKQAHLLDAYRKEDIDLADAIEKMYPDLVGGFACVVLSKDNSGEPVMAGFRDPYGIRPLVLGEKTENNETIHMLASETAGLQAANARFVREVKPGEIIVIRNGKLETRRVSELEEKDDVFELIYFASPESLFKNVPIGDIRRAMGRQLGAEYSDLELITRRSIVMGIPNSAEYAARGVAEFFGIDYVSGMRKLDNIRTFIQPTQAMREEARNKAYEFDRSLIEGQDIVLIDDSIVRLNTADHIVRKLKELGARSVVVLIASPPIIYPNFYGIDTPRQEELAAARYTTKQLQEKIGCDFLGYLSLDGMMDTIYRLTGQDQDKFEKSSFTGEYIVPIGKQHIERFARNLSAAA
jgi:amidophosphoribosyltransferase